MIHESNGVDTLNFELKSIEDRLQDIKTEDLRSGGSIRVIVNAVIDLQRIRGELHRFLK